MVVAAAADCIPYSSVAAAGDSSGMVVAAAADCIPYSSVAAAGSSYAMQQEVIVSDHLLSLVVVSVIAAIAVSVVEVAVFGLHGTSFCAYVTQTSADDRTQTLDQFVGCYRLYDTTYQFEYEVEIGLAVAVASEVPWRAHKQEESASGKRSWASHHCYRYYIQKG